MFVNTNYRRLIITKGKMLILLLIILAMVYLLSLFLPPAVDWSEVFRPAALKLLFGRSPYELDGYFNAPWALIPLMVFAILPEQIGRSVLLLVSIVSFTFTARRLGAGILAIILLLLSPPALHGFLNGNIDWLATLGFVLPPQIGLFFISTKPQIGIAVGGFWLVEAWGVNGWREVIRVFGPFFMVLLLSFLVFGLWPLRFEREIDLWWNATLWPASIPVGLALLVAAIKNNKIEFAMGASPCLSPYVLLHSWIGALMALLNSVPELIAAFVGLWILVGIQAF